MITAVPADIPVTRPVDDPTVATDGRLLLHVPPGLISIKNAVVPTHMLLGPIMPEGNPLTVAITVAAHPSAIV